MNYGLPYTGSKNRLAEKIIKHFPEADTLVEVFFGGGAMKNTSLFNTEEFLDWAYEIGKQHPVFISEYNIDDNRFTLVDSWTKFCSAAGNGTRRHTTEKLYTVK